jgi:di/tripeptidase
MRVALKIHTALDMMMRGEAGVEEWRDLCDGINVTEALCDLKKMDEELHRSAIDSSIAAMAEAMENFGELGKLRMSDRALDSLKQIVVAYDLAIGRFSQKTLAEAYTHFAVKVAKAKQRPDPSVRVVSP